MQTCKHATGTAAGLHVHGTADCDQVGTRLCCDESPFQVHVGTGTGTGAGQWQRANFTLSTGHAS